MAILSTGLEEPYYHITRDGFNDTLKVDETEELLKKVNKSLFLNSLFLNGIIFGFFIVLGLLAILTYSIQRRNQEESERKRVILLPEGPIPKYHSIFSNGTKETKLSDEAKNVQKTDF